jgi:hypothetical protein
MLMQFKRSELDVNYYSDLILSYNELPFDVAVSSLSHRAL